MASRKVEDLCPEMQSICREWMRQMDETGIDYIITCTRRTPADQETLYAQGRTTPGHIVTWTLNSRHIPGEALDFCILVNGKIDWSMVHKDLWDHAVEIGKSLGLEQVVNKQGKVLEYAHLQMRKI
jgi:peptidoglycan L-alanyl-D-glutamate endopeptidase CwlK